MPISRVTPKRLPVSPGNDFKFHIHTNPAVGRHWIYYHQPGGNRIPADNAHEELIDRVNRLKEIESNAPGGSFSINEHGQVIARMTATSGPQNAWHVVDVSCGSVYTYTQTITFLNGALDPSASASPGSVWPGPLCGTTYTFSLPGIPRPPSNNIDEIRIEVNGAVRQLSSDAGISPYPPTAGPLAFFLDALRQWLPNGGPFRVNEKGRAFTSKDSVYIGIVPPQPEWFRPISPMD